MVDAVDDTELEVEVEEEEEAPAQTYDIATYPSDFTLKGIAQMWDDEEITIPDYQREFVWTIQQSSLLIDSFLSGLPVPPVFFYIDDQNRNLVIDGQQRIMSVIFYLSGYFGQEDARGKRQTFRLKGLSDKAPWANKKFTELGDVDQRRLRGAVLRAVNIRQLKPIDGDTSAYHIFERLNTGGTPLKSQEIRNVVFRGDFNNMLKQFNLDPNWRLVIGKAVKDKHQKDVELLLRVFSLVEDIDGYEKPLVRFLNMAMRQNQNGDTPKVARFFDRFSLVTDMVAGELGQKPFHLRGKLNVSALDAVLSVLIEYYDDVDRSKLADCWESLKGDTAFDEATRYNTTDTATVQTRVALVRKYLLS